MVSKPTQSTCIHKAWIYWALQGWPFASMAQALFPWGFLSLSPSWTNCTRCGFLFFLVQAICIPLSLSPFKVKWVLIHVKANEIWHILILRHDFFPYSFCRIMISIYLKIRRIKLKDSLKGHLSHIPTFTHIYSRTEKRASQSCPPLILLKKKSFIWTNHFNRMPIFTYS